MVKGHPTKTVRAIEKLLEESSICEQWMTTKVYTVKPSDSVRLARALLRQNRISQPPVVGGGKLLGIVTDHDLRDAASSATMPRSLEEVSVQTIMSSPAISLSCHSALVNAAEVMRLQRIGSVPIVSGDSLVGIVTRSDILEAFVACANGRYKRVDRAHV
jgi:acetoin utilization protein AcuB